MVLGNREVLCNDARAEAVVALEQFLNDEASFAHTIAQARKVSRCKWYRRMIAELEDYSEPRLPYSPKDTTSNLDNALAAIERAVLLLRSGRTFKDVSPALTLVAKALGYTLLLSFLLLILLLFIFVISGTNPWLEKLFLFCGITAASAFGCVFAAYVVGQIVAGVHIFRVRILRQDLRHKLTEDIWPYRDREMLEVDKSKLKVGSSLPAAP